MTPSKRKGSKTTTEPAGTRPVDEPAAAELLAAARAGDEQAVARLYDSYASPLYAYGLRRLGDPTMAAELVQRVMTKLWRRAAAYDPARGTVGAYVFAMARTAALDLLRDAGRRPVVLADPGDISDPSASEEIDELLAAEVVRTALDRLSPQHREVLELAYFRGLSQSEAGRALGLPLGTVKSRTYYALCSLRLALEELGVTP